MIISVLSDGKLYFAGVLTNSLDVIRKNRLGRPVYITEVEATKIRIIGPLSLIILSILIKLFNIESLSNFIFVSTIISITNMFPLPSLDGFHILFNSRPIYIFTTLFIIITGILLNLISGFLALTIGLTITILGFFIYMYKIEPKTKV